ncbi:MAG: hypothetical protein IKL97_03080, partial [Eggerthellaceae bacterium]|nr:hypothetical protein [Eggerthellaceae bacterium]
AIADGAFLNLSSITPTVKLCDPGCDEIVAVSESDSGFIAVALDKPESVGSPDLETTAANELTLLDAPSDESPLFKKNGSTTVHLVSFDSSGSVISSYPFARHNTNDVAYESIAMGSFGTPAVITSVGYSALRTIFFADGLESAPITLSDSADCVGGAWLSNGSWIEMNWSNSFREALASTKEGDAKGSPNLNETAADTDLALSAAGYSVHYLITETLDGNPAGGMIGGGDNPEKPAGDVIAPTGDSSASLAGVFAGTALLSLAVLAIRRTALSQL